MKDMLEILENKVDINILKEMVNFYLYPSIIYFKYNKKKINYLYFQTKPYADL